MTRPRTIAELGEFGFLGRLLPRVPLVDGTVVGPGQDCAVVRGAGRLLFTVDALVEGVHFDWRWMTPREVGRKAFLVNASDIAAMGGRARYCVVAFGVPAATPVTTLNAVQRGLVAAAQALGCGVVGGNLTRSAQLTVTVALLGDAPRRQVTRAGARPGDRIYVTGTLGDAALALQALGGRGARRLSAALRRRLVEPTPRLEAGRWLAESGVATAMIDVSDGLVQDLGHVCVASGVGAVVRAADVPRSAAARRIAADVDARVLCGGEDYELAFCVGPRHVWRLEAARARLGCPITYVGDVRHGRGVRVVDAAGRPVPLTGAGWDHFTTARAGGGA